MRLVLHTLAGFLMGLGAVVVALSLILAGFDFSMGLMIGVILIVLGALRLYAANDG